MDKLYGLDAQGILIRNARKNLGLSQKEMSEYLNISQSTIGMWESGKRRVTSKYIKPLCDKLEIPYNVFIDANGVEKSKTNQNMNDLSALVVLDRLLKNGEIKTEQRFKGEFKTYLNIISKEFFQNGYKLVVKKVKE